VKCLPTSVTRKADSTDPEPAQSGQVHASSSSSSSSSSSILLRHKPIQTKNKARSSAPGTTVHQEGGKGLLTVMSQGNIVVVSRKMKHPQIGGMQIAHMWARIRFIIITTMAILFFPQQVTTQTTTTYSPAASYTTPPKNSVGFAVANESIFSAHYQSKFVNRWSIANNTLIRRYDYLDALSNVAVSGRLTLSVCTITHIGHKYGLLKISTNVALPILHAKSLPQAILCVPQGSCWRQVVPGPHILSGSTPWEMELSCLK
jgi:hypothetical protein